MSNKKLVLISLILGVFHCSFNVDAQISLPGKPYSYALETNQADSRISLTPKLFILPKILNDEMLLRAAQEESRCENCIDYYGVGIDTYINVKSGNSFPVKGGTIWLVKIESQNSYGLQLHFSAFKLPQKASLFVYNEDRTITLGAFTHVNNHIDNKFATQLISGKSITVEYFEASDNSFEGEVEIDRVIHSFKPWPGEVKSSEFERALPCTIDINCPDEAMFKDIKKAICRISVFDQNNYLAGRASGFLINNMHTIRKPYVLTSWHILSNPNSWNLQDRFDDWIFEFDYEADVCGSTFQPISRQSHQGASVVTGDETLFMSSSGSDYLLLDLQTTTIENWLDVAYLGWDIRPDATYKRTLSIHHPDGDVKKISHDYEAPITVNTYVQNYSIFDRNINPKTDWKINWNKGITMGGSSGSPLMDYGSHLAIGYLRAGTSDCDINGNNVVSGPDYYSRLSNAWNLYNTSLFYYPLGHYLDPYYTNTKILGNYIPNPTIDPPDPGGGGTGALSEWVTIYPGVSMFPTYTLGSFTDSQVMNCEIAPWKVTVGEAHAVKIPLKAGGGKCLRMASGGWSSINHSEVSRAFSFEKDKEYILTLRVYVDRNGDEIKVTLKNNIEYSGTNRNDCGGINGVPPVTRGDQTLMVLDRSKIFRPTGYLNFATYSIKFVPNQDFKFLSISFYTSANDPYDPQNRGLSYAYVDEIYLFEKGDYIDPQSHDNITYNYSSQLEDENCTNESIIFEKDKYGNGVVVPANKIISIASKAIFIKDEFKTSYGADVTFKIDDCISCTDPSNPFGPLEIDKKTSLLRESTSVDQDSLANPDLLYDYSKYTNIYRPIEEDLSEDYPLNLRTTSAKIFAVFPNPASNKIYVKPLFDIAPVHFELLSLSGKILKSGAFNDNFNIDLEDLPENLYILRIYSGKAIETFKISKLNK